MKMNTFYSLIYVPLLLLVVGCAETKSATKVAGIGVVRVKTPLVLVSVDGKPGNMKGKFNWVEVNYYASGLIGSYYDARLEPGAHTLEFVNVDNHADSMLSQTKVFNVEAGCVYEAGFIKDAPTVKGIPIIAWRDSYHWTLVIENVK